MKEMKVFATIASITFVSCHLMMTAPCSGQDLYSRDNLVAWCIVPYDNVKRTPEQRASMLRELGIKQFAYDWRDEHLPTMREEIRVLHKNNIKLKAVWFWVNGSKPGYLDDNNEFILKTLKEEGVKTELWLSFSNQFFEGLTDQEKFTEAVHAITEINKKARAIGCSVRLYNHGGWFGEPANQVSIIKAIGSRDLGIVYNFHHARHQIDQFPQLLALMAPYLSTVNINGMKADGPIALTVGEGTSEKKMLQQLKDSGFRGTIGILGHIEDEDARVVLERNLKGLEKIAASLE